MKKVQLALAMLQSELQKREHEAPIAEIPSKVKEEFQLTNGTEFQRVRLENTIDVEH